MINYHTELRNALNDILPTYYELVLHSGIETPCISYMERNNYVEANGDTIGYSKISYQIKIWSHSIAEIQDYVIQVDDVLRQMGFKRTSSGELYDINSTMIQKILVYEALANEEF